MFDDCFQFKIILLHSTTTAAKYDSELKKMYLKSQIFS